jgi:hypothetical protein
LITNSPPQAHLASHAIVAMMRVTVASEPGKGSVFTVRLPGGATA